MLVNPKANFTRGFKTAMNLEKYLEQIEHRNLRILLRIQTE